MAYIVARKSEGWEIRESRATPAGPRARTLATFRTLTPDVLEHARTRSTGAINAQELRRAALQLGAPVSAESADRAAGELLAELSRGCGPRPALRQLLLDTLQDQPTAAPGHRASDSARAAAAWVTATPHRRGETLRDLLLLTDRLPPAAIHAPRRFPRMRSGPA
jgi:hypothetical protein